VWPQLGAFEWSAVMDNRVCDDCGELDQKCFDPSDPDFSMIDPPLHSGCRCFIDEKVPIYTDRGWRPIGNVAVGDLVLTHKRRFKKVTQLSRARGYAGEVVKIWFRRSTGTSLSVTPEHPLWIDNRWVEAKDVKCGDKLSVLAVKCHRCGKLAPYWKKYCSRSCLSKDITDRQWSNVEHRRNMSRKASAQLKKEYAVGIRDGKAITEAAHKKCREQGRRGEHYFQRADMRARAMAASKTPEIRAMFSRRMKLHNPNRIPEVRARMTASYRKTLLKHPEKHPNFVMAQKGFISSIEKAMKTFLVELGIDFSQQHPIKKYFVDFALPDVKIAIEVDGHYWHRDSERDNARQREIEREGWLVIRFGEDEMMDDPEGCKNRLQRILKNHAGEYQFVDVKVTKVEKWKLRKPRRLFNFAVEEDESYIAKGVVVHNCLKVGILKTELERYPVEITDLTRDDVWKYTKRKHWLGPAGFPKGALVSARGVGALTVKGSLEANAADVRAAAEKIRKRVSGIASSIVGSAKTDQEVAAALRLVKSKVVSRFKAGRRPEAILDDIIKHVKVSGPVVASRIKAHADAVREIEEALLRMFGGAP